MVPAQHGWARPAEARDQGLAERADVELAYGPDQHKVVAPGAPIYFGRVAQRPTAVIIPV